MTMQAWIAFAILVTVLSLTPGPAVLLVLSQALSRGIGRTAWAILGIVVANTLYFAISGIGLSAILVASPNLFTAIKWIGAGYLVVLGAVEVFSKNVDPSPITNKKDSRASAAMFLKGFILQVSSPAALLFFVAVIPQFLNLKTPLASQVILLALTGNVAELFVLFFYAGIADQFSKFVANGPFRSSIRRVSGLLLIAAGAGMAILNK